MKKILYIAIAASTISACSPNIKSEVSRAGTADFSRYVAVGNSLCAGFADNALYREGQENSYPNMLAQQFRLAGGGDFKIPYMAATGKGNNAGTPALGKLELMPNGMGGYSPVASSDTTPVYDAATVVPAGPYNMIGVPGARALDALSPFTALNPFFARTCLTPGVSTMISEAKRVDPTFFTFWLGANDVLGYATNGASGPIQTNPNSFAFPGTLSHPDAVGASIRACIVELTKNGAKGAIANIPDVQSTPYFTTVKHDDLVLSRQGQVDSLNAGYAAYNAAVPAAYKITWALGRNAIVILDSLAPGYRRKATPQDLICLSAASLLPTGPGSATPLADNYVLDASEVALVQQYTNDYNARIKALATEFGLAFVDANSYLKTFANGLKYNGVGLSATFVSGGGFSLDGVHPTPRGYALIANEFIKAINKTYGSTLHEVDAMKYRSLLLP
ncbi:MAG: hypothetical protein RL660_1976 [Bacteroidota bacterium]|jgi:hypothetical protein